MVYEIFFLLGMVMIVGFIANLLFKRTKIPDVLFLIIVGILLGPIFGVVDPSSVMSYATVISAFMLIVIMLDNGLSFDIFKVTKALPITTVFTIAVVGVNAIILAGIFMYFAGLPMISALIIALCISGSTTDVITILTSKMKIKREARQLLIIESVLNDIQIIPFFILLRLAQTSQFDAGTLVYLLMMPIAVCFGAIFATVWIALIGRRLGAHPLNYVATLGILFILYALIQTMGGSGPVAVLTFSLVMGNAMNLFDHFNVRASRLKFGVRVLKTFREIETDVSFFVRTMFFVFLGIVFSLHALRPFIITLSFVLFGAILAIRYVLLKLLVSNRPEYKDSMGPLVWVCPRGYVAAVLAFAAAGSGLFGNDVVEIVLMNVFLTTFVAILYTIWHGKKVNKKSSLRR